MGNSKKHLFLLLFFLVLYLFALNLNWNTDFAYDEGRHAMQGVFFYDYSSYVFSNGYLPLIDFLDLYSKNIYAIDWFAMYDPPAHAVSTALVFFLFGISTFTARLTTELWVVFGSLLLYFLSKKILHDEKYALFTAVLFLFSPFTYYFSRQAMLAIPIALLTAGWFYFFFYGKGRKKFIAGTLCLAAAALMQYQTMLFAGAFMIVYCGWLFAKEWRKHKKADGKNSDKEINYENDKIKNNNQKDDDKNERGNDDEENMDNDNAPESIYLKKNNETKSMHENKKDNKNNKNKNDKKQNDEMALSSALFSWLGKQQSFAYLKIFLLQVIIFFIIAAPWLLFSWGNDSNAFNKMFIAGLEEGKNTGIFYWLYFFIAIFRENWFVTIFALLPLWHWKKINDEQKRMYLFILTTLLISTFFITNKQLRYMVHALPFLYILSVQGIILIEEKIKKKYVIFTALLLLSIAGSFFINQSSAQTWGKADPDLADYLAAIPEPRYFFIKDLAGPKALDDGSTYFYLPDKVHFLARTQQELAESETYTRSVLPMPLEQYLPFLQNATMNTVMLIAKADQTKNISAEGFSKVDLHYYTAYQRLTEEKTQEKEIKKERKISGPFQQRSAIKKGDDINTQANAFARQKKYEEALPLYEEALTLSPEALVIKNNLEKIKLFYAQKLHEEANAAAKQKEYEKAIALYKKSLSLNTVPIAQENLAKARHFYAEELIAQGKYEDARAQLEENLKIYPNHNQTIELLESIQEE